jgi:nucleoside-diphosphate-sugar epimerase
MRQRFTFITCARGFIGLNLPTKLTQAGDEVTLVDSLHPQCTASDGVTRCAEG